MFEVLLLVNILRDVHPWSRSGVYETPRVSIFTYHKEVTVIIRKEAKDLQLEQNHIWEQHKQSAHTIHATPSVSQHNLEIPPILYSVTTKEVSKLHGITGAKDPVLRLCQGSLLRVHYHRPYAVLFIFYGTACRISTADDWIALRLMLCLQSIL
jgi:hypothetical protein